LPPPFTKPTFNQPKFFPRIHCHPSSLLRGPCGFRPPQVSRAVRTPDTSPPLSTTFPVSPWLAPEQKRKARFSSVRAEPFPLLLHSPCVELKRDSRCSLFFFLFSVFLRSNSRIGMNPSYFSAVRATLLSFSLLVLAEEPLSPLFPPFDALL